MILEWKKHSAKNPRIFFFSILKNLMQRTVQRKELIMVSTEHEVWLEQIDYTIALQQTHMIWKKKKETFCKREIRIKGKNFKSWALKKNKSSQLSAILWLSICLAEISLHIGRLKAFFLYLCFSRELGVIGLHNTYPVLPHRLNLPYFSLDFLLLKYSSIIRFQCLSECSNK